MEIIKNAVAGTLESSDVMITVDVNPENKIEISLTSSVEKQFGDQIKAVIINTLSLLGVTSAKVIANDKGALDCTIQARTIAAVYRSNSIENYDWKEINSWNA